MDNFGCAGILDDCRRNEGDGIRNVIVSAPNGDIVMKMWLTIIYTLVLGFVFVAARTDDDGNLATVFAIRRHRQGTSPGISP